MLSEIAAEVLLFLTRRDLDKACAVSKWLDAMINQCCAVYPLRPVNLVMLRPSGNKFTLQIWVDKDEPGIHHSLGSMDEAVRFVGSILRHTFVEYLQFGDGSATMTLLADHWTTLIGSLGTVQHLHFCESLDVELSVVPDGFVTDGIILDFFFPADAASRGQSLGLVLPGSGITDAFLKKCFERLQSSPVRPNGSLVLDGAAKQRGLAAYASHLAPGSMHGNGATYRLLIDRRQQHVLRGRVLRVSCYTRIRFCLMKRLS